MKRLSLCLAATPWLWAQSSEPPPLAVHRQAPPPMPSLTEIQEAAKILSQNNPATSPSVPPVSSPPLNSMEGPPLLESNPVPKGYKVKTEVALDSATAQALSLATGYLEKPNVPHLGKDGRLIYTYGAGLPTLVCAPLRWCLIELIPGETAKSAIPSDERWDAKPLLDTSGELPQSLIAMRPRYSGLDASLIILTDKHSYFIRLVSEPNRYMSRITFDDPEATRLKATEISWNLYQLQASAMAVTQPANKLTLDLPKAEPVIQPYFVTGEKGFWGHEKRPYFWPIAAYAKEGLVYIVLPKQVTDRRSPELYLLGDHGKAEPLNHSTEGSTIIAHSLFDRAVLQRGNGKQAERVYLTRPKE